MILSKKILSVLLSLLFVIPFPLLTLGKAHAQAPRVYLDPTPLTLEQVGNTGTVEVRLSDVSSLSAFEVGLSYDSSKIHIDEIEVPSSVGGSPVGPTIDNEAGEATFGAWTLERDADDNFVSILGGQEVLATISLTAVGEGSTPLSFAMAQMLGTTAEAGEEPPPVEVATEDGLVQVGTPSGTEITLRSGGNRVTWPSGLNTFTSLSALESIETDCGGAQAISRKKNGWWESAVHGYGGADFGLNAGGSYYVTVTSSCSWTP